MDQVVKSSYSRTDGFVLKWGRTHFIYEWLFRTDRMDFGIRPDMKWVPEKFWIVWNLAYIADIWNWEFSGWFERSLEVSFGGQKVTAKVYLRQILHVNRSYFSALVWSEPRSSLTNLCFVCNFCLSCHSNASITPCKRSCQALFTP